MLLGCIGCVNEFCRECKLILRGASMSRILIVGKNSKIVKSIECDLDGIDMVSHKDLDKLDISTYDKVFVFSWNFKSLDDNLSLINRLIIDRVVFISTIAVLACARRHQWASYPNAKRICENLVLSGGGQVIRIGIWDESLVKNLSGTVPITTPKNLLEAMRKCLDDNTRVIWSIDLHHGRLGGVKHFISNILNKISISLPSIKLIQAPIALGCKLLGLKDYGYTHDCLCFFSRRVLVGFGAVGSAVSEELDLRGFGHAIVVSGEKNILLNSNGFRGMRLGQFKEGLSKLWHGVWITKKEDKAFYKNVPLFVRRPKVPSRAICGTVCRIDISKPMASVEIENSKVADVRVFAEVIHLAAGVINNIRILQGSNLINANFSDHEIGELGVVKTQDLMTHGLVNCRLGFVFGRKVLKGRHKNLDYLIDFRPKASNFIKFDTENIYNNRGDQIIRKLLMSLSPSLVNQALFNRFGISFDVGVFSVVVQIDAPNCINLTNSGELLRTRLPPIVFDSIAEELSVVLKSFCKTRSPQTFDAIHVHGGFILEQFPSLRHHLESKRLFLHGNVLDGSPLGPFHNTVSMIAREREVIKNV
jgi:hypothetical protein